MAVRRAMNLAKERGAKRVLDLPVSAPFHCELMRPAAVKDWKDFSTIFVIRPLTIGVVSNVEAEVNLDCRSSQIVSWSSKRYGRCAGKNP